MLETFFGVSILFFLVFVSLRIAYKEHRKHMEILELQKSFYGRALDLLDSNEGATVNLIHMFDYKDGVSFDRTRILGKH